MTQKERLERLILDVLEASYTFCLDNEQERAALADVITVDVMGRFKLMEKARDKATSTLARVF